MLFSKARRPICGAVGLLVGCYVLLRLSAVYLGVA